MQNNVLKNNIAPWQEKGRWYHVVLSSDGTTWTIEKDLSDGAFQSAYISGTFLLLSTPFENGFIMDCKAGFHSKPADTLSLIYASFYMRITPNYQGVFLSPPASYIGTVDLWIFINNL